MEAESYNWVNNGEWGNEVFYPACKKINKAVHMKNLEKIRNLSTGKRQNIYRKNEPLNKLLGHTKE